MFVVPYLHMAHCLSVGYLPKCRVMKERHVRRDVHGHLPFYNASTAERHLFFLSDSEYLVHKWIVGHPLLAMYGPRWDHNSGFRGRANRQTTSPPGHIIIPQFNSLPDFQPSVVIERQQEEQERNLSLAFVSEFMNRRMAGGPARSPRFRRKYLLDSLSQTPNISGLPLIANNSPTKFNKESAHEGGLYGLYRRSILCPILAGDISWQRRFFDVMACGCLPVVMHYKLTLPFVNQTNEAVQLEKDWTNKYSWYVPEQHIEIGNTWSVRESFPFVDEIDYKSFTVQVEGNYSVHTDMSHVTPALEAFLSDTEGLKRKQEALRETVVKFLYGVGPDAHRYDDAFAHLIRSLRFYLNHLNKSAE